MRNQRAPRTQPRDDDTGACVRFALVGTTKSCVCECLDSTGFAGSGRFQSGTVQGNNAGTNEHRGNTDATFADQSTFFGSMSEFDAVTADGKSIFNRADADGATPTLPNDEFQSN